MGVRTRKHSKGNATLAGFILVLLAATWTLGGTTTTVLPCTASRFLAVLNMEEVGGEHVGLWERVSAGLVLASKPPSRICSKL